MKDENKGKKDKKPIKDSGYRTKNKAMRKSSMLKENTIGKQEIAQRSGTLFRHNISIGRKNKC